MKALLLLLLPVSLLAAPVPPGPAKPAPASAAAPPVATGKPPAASPTPPAAPGAAGDPLDALAADSPFLPGTGGRGPAAAGPTGPLELRSVVFVDGSYRFSIFDQGTGQSNWVRIGEREQPYVARSFDRERDTLTVEHQGRTMVLALQPARMASSGAAPPNSPAPLPGPAQGGPANGRTGQSGGPTPTMSPGNAPPPGAPNAAEAQRLQNLADEIRRRRGLGARINLPQAQPPAKKN